METLIKFGKKFWMNRSGILICRESPIPGEIWNSFFRQKILKILFNIFSPFFEKQTENDFFAENVCFC